MSTVLPTPAPPKSPALPPRSIGQSRSIALMPVSKISDWVRLSLRGGGGFWIERRGASVSGGPPSIGSPKRFSIRPSVVGPTGISMPPPVAVSYTHLRAHETVLDL